MSVSAISESEEEMEEEEGEEEELQANPAEEEVSIEDEVELQGNDSSTQRSDTGTWDSATYGHIKMYYHYCSINLYYKDY